MLCILLLSGCGGGGNGDNVSLPNGVLDIQDAAAATAEGPVLVISDFTGRQLARLPSAYLAGLSLLQRNVELQITGQSVPVRGVSLLDVLADLDMPGNWNFVLADSSDGLQSNFTREILRHNFPFLILEIEGMPTHEWTRLNGNPEWGPFMIQTLLPEGLLDPEFKSPAGVTQLRVGTFDAFWQLFAARVPSLSVEHDGFRIWKANCMSCHRKVNTYFGGTLSDRNLTMIATSARYSEAYFRALLKDPAGTNILAKKMPASTHYSGEQISQLIAFLRYFAP